MKKSIWVGLVLIALGQVTLAAETVLLTDDFETAPLDTSKWTVIKATGHDSFDEASAGSSVTDTPYMWLKNAAVDAGGAYKSMLLPVNDRGEIIITRNNYVDHKGDTLVSMPDEILAEDGTVLLRWGYHNYNDGSTSRYGFGGFNDSLVAGVWGGFFDETITYDPITGEGTYSLNSGTSVTISGAPLPAEATNLYLRGSAYGEGSLEYWKAIQDFTVSQVDVSMLSINSEYGSSDPAVGEVFYDSGTVVTCSVDHIVSTGGWGTPVIRYQCTGWTGTGSVPASGTTNVVAVTLDENSSITWSWAPIDAVLTVNSWLGGSPSPAVGAASYAIGSNVTCSVQNEVTVDGIRYECSGWTGTGSVPASGTTNVVVVPIGETSAITWAWQNLDSKLAVVSAYGDPAPSVGEVIYLADTVVTCSVENVIGADTRHFCTGWGTARDAGVWGFLYLASGTNNWVDLTLDFSSIRLTWIWQSDHWLDVQIQGSGTVSHTAGFYDEGVSQTLIATPAEGWVFDGWAGDASGTGNASVTMTAPKSVTAMFSVPALIANISVAQVEGARAVEVSYDVDGTRELLVDLAVYQNGSNLNASALSGALGMVSAGTNKVITWNAGTDWNLHVDELTFRLLSEDGLPFYAPYSLDAPSLVPQTGQTNDFGYAETDGDLRPGLEWPESRFADNGDDTVTDNMTGLTWGKSYTSAYWGTAMQNCDNSTLAGHDDWRLPNVRELRSLFSDFSRYNPVLEMNVIFGNPIGAFWTSTIFEYSPGYAYRVSSIIGEVYPYLISRSLTYPPYIQYYSAYCLPVRGSATGQVHVAKTGQVYSHSSSTTEDGDLQLGEAWPDPRFTDHGDGMATDNLTGLMWTANTASQQTWYNALAVCGGMTAGGFDDWRLPSVLELESLIDFGQRYPAPMLPAEHPFSGVVPSSGEAYHYWTSTTRQGQTSYAYKTSFYDGRTYSNSKGSYSVFFACRGGREIQENIPEATTYEPLPITGQTNSFVAGDDGDLQKGVQEVITPYIGRFTHSGSGRYHDRRTGLEWYVSDGYNTLWSSAIDACEYSSMAGATDWRLPNVREMLSLLDYSQSAPMLPEGHPFTDWTNVVYWTSTASPYDTDYALTVNLNNGSVSTGYRGVSEYCFCLVRWMTEPSDIAAVPKTGQTFSLQTGDDGDYQMGVSVSGERFADNGNGTVNDNQTGLMWLKDAGATGRADWTNAVEACESMHLGNYNDWRLPNAREMESLIHYSTNSPVSPDVFTNVKFIQGAAYWTSTTSAGNPDMAVEFYFDTARQYPQYKENMRYLWPVRGGN